MSVVQDFDVSVRARGNEAAGGVVRLEGVGAVTVDWPGTAPAINVLTYRVDESIAPDAVLQPAFTLLADPLLRPALTSRALTAPTGQG